jgi:hypothetical protein
MRVLLGLEDSISTAEAVFQVIIRGSRIEDRDTLNFLE